MTVEIPIVELAVAVFIGNIMTLAFWACFKTFNTEDEKKIPGIALAGALIILAVTVATLIGQNLEPLDEARAEASLR